MKDGDVSLVLNNVTFSDEGVYKCHVFSREGNEKKEYITTITLTVVSQHTLVEVEEGQGSVLLPCEFPTSDMKDRHVEWSRPDLYPSMVHRRREDGDDLQDQNQNFRERTSMAIRALETGDLSLTLIGPGLNDTGRYTCSVFYSGQRVRSFDVQLEVHEAGVRVLQVVLPVVLLMVLVAAISVLWFFRNCFMKVPQVEVDSGVESVLLPRKTNVLMTDDVTVKWTDNTRKIHVYQNGFDHPEEQDRRYRGRTEMNKDLKTGGVSLTLKYPTLDDSGRFLCTISSNNGNLLMKKEVELKVRVCQVEVEEGTGSVLLSFRTTPDLPGDTRVKWCRCEPGPVMMVHLYQNGSEQSDEQNQFYRGRTEMSEDLLRTGDLSLRLKNPTETDSGGYRCEVESRDIRRSTTVMLKVKGTVQVQGPTEDIRTSSSSPDPTPLLPDSPVSSVGGSVPVTKNQE